jgi:FkbM family methyltransferase
VIKQRHKLVTSALDKAELLSTVSRSRSADAVLATYLRLKLKQSALALRSGRHNGRPRLERVLGWSVAYFDYGILVDLFEEMFMQGHYLFEASSSRPLIIDCGSNIGMSVLYHKRLYPDSKILAFEPDPLTFSLLRRNISANGLTGVELVNKAVCDRDDLISFYVDPECPGSLLMSTRQARLPKRRIEVPGTLLSNYVDSQVDLLKMDIEGAEEMVIRDLIKQDKLGLIREMIFEYHHHIRPTDDDLGTLLSALEERGFGYQLLTPYMTGFHSPSAFQDVLVHAYQKRWTVKQA